MMKILILIFLSLMTFFSSRGQNKSANFADSCVSFFTPNYSFSKYLFTKSKIDFNNKPFIVPFLNNDFQKAFILRFRSKHPLSGQDIYDYFDVIIYEYKNESSSLAKLNQIIEESNKTGEYAGPLDKDYDLVLQSNNYLIRLNEHCIIGNVKWNIIKRQIIKIAKYNYGTLSSHRIEVLCGGKIEISL